MQVGLAVFAIPTALQIVWGLYGIAAGQLVQGLFLLVAPLLLLVLLCIPVRESQWPLTARRAGLVGAMWLLVGLGSMISIYGALPLLASPVAAVLALLGALGGHLADRR